MNRPDSISNAAVPAPALTNEGWLTLQQASRRLGVHPATLRRWVNQGALEVFLTPGGHRRFRLAEIDRFERDHRSTRLPSAPEQRWTDQAIAQARLGLQHQRWLVDFDEADREAKRQLGRRLMGLVFQYLALPEERSDLLAEARTIGEQHAWSGIQHGQPLNEMLQAIGFFRTTLLEVAILGLPHTTASQPEVGTRLLRKIERLLGEVQAGVVEPYVGATRTSAAAEAPSSPIGQADRPCG